MGRFFDFLGSLGEEGYEKKRATTTLSSRPAGTVSRASEDDANTDGRDQLNGWVRSSFFATLTYIAVETSRRREFRTN